MTTLRTVGHGTLAAPQLADLLRGAGIELVVDVRAHPGSRRHPHFGHDQLAAWLPAAGIGYRWEGPRLGGRRSVRPDSPNLGLRNASFRGFADHMATPAFTAALTDVLTRAAGTPTTVMCAESLWWRCHRRLVADAAVLVHGATVQHLAHDGRLTDHVPTEAARLEADHLVYDRSQPPLLP